MIENIKVYKRSDVVKEIKDFYIRKRDNKIFLNPTGIQGERYYQYDEVELVQNDPLNKFTNDKACWFSECGSYLLTENNKKI